MESGDWNNTLKFAKWLHEDAKNNQPYLAYLGLDIPHPWPTPAHNWEHVDVGGDSTFGTSDYYLPSINTSLITGIFCKFITCKINLYVKYQSGCPGMRPM